MAFLKKFLLSFAIFAIVCATGLLWFVNSEVEKGFNKAVADIENLTIDYADLDVSFTDQNVCLDGVAATFPEGQHLTADRICFDSFDQENTIPHFMKARAKGVTMKADYANVGDWATTLRSLDLGTITGDVDLDYAYTPDNDALTIKKLKISMPDVGDIDLSGVLDSLELELFRAEKLIGLRICDLKIKFANHSFMDALMRESGKWLSTSKEEARRRICTEITAMADYAGKKQNQIAENALRGLKRYVDDPHALTITASPNKPVPVLYFFMGRDLYDNMQLMNLKIITDSNEDI